MHGCVSTVIDTPEHYVNACVGGVMNCYERELGLFSTGFDRASSVTPRFLLKCTVVGHNRHPRRGKAATTRLGRKDALGLGWRSRLARPGRAFFFCTVVRHALRQTNLY